MLPNVIIIIIVVVVVVVVVVVTSLVDFGPLLFIALISNNVFIVRHRFYVNQNKMASLPRFHSRAGTLVTLSNDNRTAHRSHPTQEFNNGVVLSAQALKDDQVFEVKIDKKVSTHLGISSFCFSYFVFILAC